MMAENEKMLLLRLEGPLQSWGEHSKWDHRDTANLPTKSGIVGLLACALGFPREDPRIAELSAELKMAVRADRPGIRTTDFQTVTGMNPTSTGPRMMTAEGTPRNGNTIISKRDYLQDASFLVVLQGENELMDNLAAALDDPVWPYHLGRKNCIPTRPILDGVTEAYPDLLTALKKIPLSKNAHLPVMYETEEPDINSIQLLRSDELLNGYRHFALRTVYRGVLKEVPNVSYEN